MHAKEDGNVRQRMHSPNSSSTGMPTTYNRTGSSQMNENDLRAIAKRTRKERCNTPEKGSQKIDPPDYIFTTSTKPIDFKTELHPGPNRSSRFEKIEFQHSVPEDFDITDNKKELTSYWSVSERTEFIDHVSSFGTNWQKIAQNMPRKNATMVRRLFIQF